MRVSIVVPIASDLDRAWSCFESLARLPESPEHEIVVVDDDAPGLDLMLARLGGDVRCLRTGERSGFAAAANLGALGSESDVIVLLRDAPAVAEGWLSGLLDSLQREDVVAAASAVAGRISKHPVESCALAVWRPLYERVGGCPEVADELVLAALCAELGRLGTIETAPGSVVTSFARQPGRPHHEASAGPELSIVIPTLDSGGDRVRDCLRAIAATTAESHEVIVVDNGSSPQGYTAPVNAGIRAASGRHLVIMNDDVEVLPGWWPPLRAGLSAGAAVTFPLTIAGGMRTDFAAWCFALSREAVEHFGERPGEFFDTRFTVWYQDTDLLLRLRAAGCPPVLIPESQIRHGLSQTVNSTIPELSAWIRAQISLDQQQFRGKHPTATVKAIGH